MMVSEYSRRVIELFESGKATKAQKAEMVEAVLSAFEQGAWNVAATHKAIGFDAAQAAEVSKVEERYPRAMAVA
jgi:hypothetical protein